MTITAQELAAKLTMWGLAGSYIQALHIPLKYGIEAFSAGVKVYNEHIAMQAIAVRMGMNADKEQFQKFIRDLTNG